MRILFCLGVLCVGVFEGAPQALADCSADALEKARFLRNDKAAIPTGTLNGEFEG